MDVDDAGDRLYGRPPAEFTAARDELVRAARAEGDRPAAAAIAALRKPTVTAWLLNLLVRRHQDEVAAFVEIGPQLRAASAARSGPELRELSAQRQRLVGALVQRARTVGSEAGQRVGEDALRGVEDTLHAALADPDAADQLLAGRLTHPLQRTGFEPGPAAAASRPPQPPPGRTRTARSAKARRADEGADERAARRAARRAELEAELARAWAEARGAADARDEAQREEKDVTSQLASATREVDRLTKERDRLRADLDRVEGELSAADQARAGARENADRAARRHEQAESAADLARQEVTALQARLNSNS